MDRIFRPSLMFERSLVRLPLVLGLALLLSLIVAPGFALASGYCRDYPEPGSVPGVCGSRLLPGHQTRNLRNVELECGSGVDHYRRSFQPFDYEAWQNLEASHKRDQMQAFRQKQPLIQWSGAIGYETIEHWDWTECYYGADHVCGYDRVCHDEPYTENDSDGKPVTKTREVCVDVMRSCWHDEDRHEYRFCSKEKIDYRAGLIRPLTQEKSETGNRDWVSYSSHFRFLAADIQDAVRAAGFWNPSSDHYVDIIPNKYDLLPGEIEDFQVFANSGTSTTLSPQLEVGDAWNQYSARIKFVQTRRSQASCVYNQKLDLDVAIITEGRIYGKISPNTLRLPIDENGKETNPLYNFELGLTDRGEGVENEFVRYKPIGIKLIDYSYSLISAMARQSREFDTNLEKVKDANGQGRSASPDEYVSEVNEAKSSGFWKNTVLRIKTFLLEKKWYGTKETRYFHNFFTDGAKSSTMGLFEIDLIGTGSRDDCLYYGSSPFNDWWDCDPIQPIPDQNYRFEVSMYQNGVVFYKQPDGDYKSDDSVFSKPILIPFRTPKDVEQRSGDQKFQDWRSKR